jgi:hypothetical protein
MIIMSKNNLFILPKNYIACMHTKNLCYPIQISTFIYTHTPFLPLLILILIL